MTIYIDVLFLENLILNSIILYATAIISKIKIKHWKIIISSIMGSVYVVIYYIFRIDLYINIISKVFISILMNYIAFSPKSFKLLLKDVLLFYLVSFVFGGAALGMIYIVNSNNINIKDGVILENYTLKTIFIGVVLAFLISILSFKMVKHKIGKKDMFCSIIIKLNKKKVKIRAMIDTGNLLKEPISNIPVIVVEKSVLFDIIPKEILENIDNVLGGDLSGIPEVIKQEYLAKLKVIPFSSLGKQNGMLLGIKADEVEVIEDDEIKRVDKVIIGIYNKVLSKKEEIIRLYLGLTLYKIKKERNTIQYEYCRAIKKK